MNFGLDSLIKEIITEFKLAKTLIIFGLLGLLIASLLGNRKIFSDQYLLNWSIIDLILIICLFLLVGGIIYTVLKNIIGLIKASIYTTIYSRKNLDETFHAVNFGGKAYIFDIRKKEYRWISSWQTAEDCNFHELWTAVEGSFENNLQKTPALIILISGKKIDLTQYAKNGGKIHTRGIPGT